MATSRWATIRRESRTAQVEKRLMLFWAPPRDLALGIPKTEEDFNKEFVQREWCQKIVGSTREDPALVFWFLKLDVSWVLASFLETYLC